MLPETLPAASCPVCLGVIHYWPRHRWFQLCRRCRRPLAVVPVWPSRYRVYRIVNLFGVARFACAGLALLALGALLTRLAPLSTAIIMCAAAFALQGCADLADGVAGIRTNYVRNWGRLHIGRNARAQSAAKCASGTILLLLAAFGLAIG